MSYTTLTLYSGVKLDPRFEHTIIWRDEAQKLNYFKSCLWTSTNNYTYLRPQNGFRVPFHIDELNADINYCMVAGTGIPKYYFITRKEYMNEHATLLHVELDVLQTYQSMWEIPACFVEREHVTDDTPGKHLVEEGLEVGEYVTANGIMIEDLTNLCIVVQSSVTLDNPMGQPVEGDFIAGVYSGYRLYTCSATHEGLLKINAAIKSLDTQGKTDGIVSIWMYPKNIIFADWDHEEEHVMLPVLGVNSTVITGSKQNDLNGYIPVNKKLLCYPYHFITASNMTGSQGIYKYELFGAEDGGTRFAIFGSVGVDGVVRLVPQDYRGFANDHESGISLTGFPTCAWTQDAYKIWLAQNSNTQDLNLQSGYVSLGLGAAQTGYGAAMSLGGLFTGGGDQLMANGVNMMYSGYQQIAGVMAARADKQVQPPQSKGAQSSSVNITQRMHTFVISEMCVQEEYAKRIDAFFSMYGYKVNAVKVPNLHTRILWNYVKTIGCVVLGDIDSEDRQKIAAIFDKGVTCWHDPAIMYNYNAAASNFNVAT